MELDYIKIKCGGGTIYGGDQNLFGRRAARSGCGMIALCDVLLFLRGRGGSDIPFSEYASFVEDMRDNLVYKRSPNPIGVPPRRLAGLLNVQCEGHKFAFFGRGKFTAETLAAVIKNSLEKGVPVIVRVGANGKKLPYKISFPASGNKMRSGVMSWHYITVTGISDGGELIFSSWGGKGVMSCADLYRFFGITGGVIIEKSIEIGR